MKYSFLLSFVLSLLMLASCQEEDVAKGSVSEDTATQSIVIPPPTLSTIASPFTDKLKLGVTVETAQQYDTVYCLALGENQKGPTVEELIENKRTMVVAMEGHVFRSALISKLSPDSVYTIYAAIDSAGYFSDIAQLSATTRDK